MSEHVHALSMICMFISFVLAVLVPLGAIAYLARRKKLKLKATLWGALLFVVFALVLEQLLHLLVLGRHGTTYIAHHAYLYALYGALAAGVFEETARLVGFRWLIRIKRDEGPYTGISYGLGHGGIEAILLGGIASVGSIVFSFAINSGHLPPARLQDALRLISAPAYMNLIPGVERILALVIQISLSMIVMKAVTSRNWWFYILAIGMHAFVDFPAALFQKHVLKNILAVEAFVAVVAVGYAFLAYKLYATKRASLPETTQ